MQDPTLQFLDSLGHIWTSVQVFIVCKSMSICIYGLALPKSFQGLLRQNESASLNLILLKRKAQVQGLRGLVWTSTQELG